MINCIRHIYDPLDSLWTSKLNTTLLTMLGGENDILFGDEVIEFYVHCFISIFEEKASIEM